MLRAPYTVNTQCPITSWIERFYRTLLQQLQLLCLASFAVLFVLPLLLATITVLSLFWPHRTAGKGVSHKASRDAAVAVMCFTAAARA